MKVLVNCERSGVVRREFRSRGHDAFSCDLEAADDGMHSYHFQQDGIKTAYKHRWDLMIAHPECTYLANSGAKNLYLGEGNHRSKKNGVDPVRWAQMGQAAQFFLTLLNAPVMRIAVENPIMLGHAKAICGIPEQNQIVQPWMFGEFETKGTCLWLKNLPPLVPTYKTWQECREALKLPADAKPVQRMFMMTPGPDRKKERSQTYEGIARAMADQWGNVA